jgi:Ca-activated chloride channel family protein
MRFLHFGPRPTALLAGITVLLLGLDLSAQTATGSLEGTVRDRNGAVITRAIVSLVGTPRQSRTDSLGSYRFATLAPGDYSIRVSALGFQSTMMGPVRVAAGRIARLDVSMTGVSVELQEMAITTDAADGYITGRPVPAGKMVGVIGGTGPVSGASPPPGNTEGYQRITDNSFLGVGLNPVSTFSIDVDRASYSNIRRVIAQGQAPPKDAVRIEEMLNYFPYEYPMPTAGDDHPFTLTTEVGTAPWRPAHRLVRIGLQSAPIATADLPPSNLVFLLDVSGSMGSPNKLPLVKRAMALLVEQLRAEDRVAVVVYAGSSGLVLPSTSGAEQETILGALERLGAGGSTAGGAGLRLAYRVAREQFRPDGNNRVILATDGDFNVGESSNAEMERLIESEREHGIFLTVLGFGMGNYKDDKLEAIANRGNGSFAYIDNLMEAKKMLVQEIGATLLTVAKDVKLQVEFNPGAVQAYRLIGYENRLLAREDFTDDSKDAGELGAGHSVTALYEIVPVGVPLTVPVGGADSLRYQTPRAAGRGASSDELLYVKVRYKTPTGRTSTEFSRAVFSRAGRASTDLTFASAVAAFGMVLRDSEHKGSATAVMALELARAGMGEDPHGYRAGFVALVNGYLRRPLSGGG